MSIIVCRAREPLAALARRCRLSPELLGRVNGLENAGRLVPGLPVWLPEEAGPAPRQELLALAADLPDSELDLLPTPTWLSRDRCRFTGDGVLLPPCPDPISEGPLRLLRLEPEGASPQTPHLLLREETAQAKLLEALPRVLEGGGYRGVHLSAPAIYPFDRAAELDFLGRLSALLHREGAYLLTEFAPGDLYPAERTALSDRVLLLQSEDALPSPDRLRRWLAGDGARLPAGKLLLALPGHALRWCAGDADSERIPHRLALALALSAGAALTPDPEGRGRAFSYTNAGGRRCRVCLADLSTRQRLLALPMEHGLAGLALCPWRRVDPASLAMLYSRVRVKSLP